MAGQTERRKTIGRASLSRKMLCRRHNNALSPLDKMAAEFFRHFLEDHLDIFKYLGNDDRDSFPRGFTMVSGPYIELRCSKSSGAPSKPARSK
jgi:hypothetical protein